jgi:hypothetical protein
MTEFLDRHEIHNQMKEKIRESTPTDLRNNAQRERVECDIDGQIRELRLKFKVGTNGHAIVDAKNKSIKATTHNHNTATKSLNVTSKTREENKEEINKLDEVAEIMETHYKHHRGRN